METLVVQDPRVLVLPYDPADKGSLLERFLANFLHEHFGYNEPKTEFLNVTKEGIEVDVKASHKLTGKAAMAECKAYERNVAAKELTNFYGKLASERLDTADVFGIMMAMPGLTSDGVEKARSLEMKDKNFRYLNAQDVVALLLQQKAIQSRPGPEVITSDFALVITDDGLFAAEIELDPTERTPLRVLCWKKGSCPEESARSR